MGAERHGGLSVTSLFRSPLDWSKQCTAGGDIRTLRRSKARSAGLGSGGEIGHQLYKEFGAGKLDCVDFQGVPADGPNADAENEDGELDLRKRVFTLFLPN